MKNNLLSICVWLLAVLIPITSCTDMESIHEEYLKGEIIYAGKLDSLNVFSGYKRVKIIGDTRYLGNSQTCFVEWEDQSKSFSIPEEHRDTFSLIIDGLEERGYEFEVFTMDASGHQSILQTCKGKAVGDVFAEAQMSRRIVSIETTKDGTFIKWADQAESEYVIFTEVSYRNTDGGMSIDTVYPADSYLALKNWKPLGELETVSAIISGEQGIDTIYLDKVEKTLPPPPYEELDKSLFILAGMPSDNPGTSYGANPEAYLFDGDGTWQNSDEFGYHSGENAVPHHFTVDLGVMATIRKCRLDLRDPSNYAGNNPTEVELWGIVDTTGAETASSDAAEFEAKGWQLLHRGSVDGENNQSVEFDVKAGPSIRFLRYRVVNTVNGTGAQLIEMTLWGQDILSIDLSLNALLTVNHENTNGANGAEGSLKLIDGDINSKFLIFDYPAKNPLNIQQELPQKEVVRSYTLTSGNDAPDRDPKDWSLSGSNDGVDWTVLDTKTNEIFTGRNETVTYELKNETPFKFYVISITANGGGSLFQLSEWRLYK